MPNNREKNEGISWMEVEEEPSSEEWCFECKDGGELVICDHKNCGKVYHPDCVGKEDSFFDTVKSWFCGRHFCSDCNASPKFYCIGCPYSLCAKCVVVSSEFSVVRGVKGFCIDCLELVQIIEQNLDHDSEGNKITLTDRETYECLFKEYWGVIKPKEGLTSDDISAAQHILHKKSKKSVHLKNFSKGEEKQNDWSWESDDDHRPAKRKRYNSEGFVGWGSKPLISFLVSIGKYETEPLTQWGVTSLILGYIKEKNLHHPKDKGKFLPDERLRPIFRKKVVSRGQIYSLLEVHFAKKFDDSSMEKNDDQIKRSSADKHVNDQKSSMQSRLSRLIGKPPLKKGDLFTSVEKNDDQFENSSTDKHINDQSTSMRSRLSSLIGKHPLKKGDFFTPVEKNDDQMKNSSTDKHVNDQTTSMQSRLSSLIGKPPLGKGDSFSSVEKNDDQIENSSEDKHVNDQATSMKSRLSTLIGKPPLEKGDRFSLLEKNDQIENSSEDKHVNDQATSIQSRLSSIMRKPPLKKGDFLIKLSRFASITVSNINLIYLKRSLVQELSEQTESFMGKVVGTFVKAKVDSNDSRQRMSHHLVRVEGVVLDEMSNETLLQVSFMAKAIPFSKLSDEEFTEEECEDLRQNVKSGLVPKLTVVEVQEKANCLHEDITKHRILTRLVHLQNQIERANLRGRNKQKIELLEEREKLEQSWKQEQLFKRVPVVRPDFIESKYDDAEEHELETD